MKKGDVVKCINDNWMNNKGKNYRILDINYTTCSIKIQVDDINYYWYDSSYFKLINKELIEIL